MHVLVVGPAEPREVLGDSDLVDVPLGMGGTPVNGLVTALLELGHNVSLVTASPNVRTTWRVRHGTLRIAVVPYRQSARTRALDFFSAERRAIAEEVRKVPADVVHAHWTYEFALGALAARMAPVLVTAHDAPLTILRHLPDPYRLVRFTIAYRARASIPHLTAVSPYLARQWRRQMVYRRPIAIIPNPIPKLDVQAALRESRPRLLSVSDAGPLKNVFTLVRAFAEVRAAHREAVLRLVGPGLGPGDRIASRARLEGLDGGVEFVGRLDRARLSDEYSRATVFCHPSLEESQGMVLLEALSAGLPVVAGADSGGVPWTLFDGKAGRLVNVRSPHEVAQGLLDAICDPSSTVASGFDVAAELRARYAPPAVAAAYVNEYRLLLGQST